MYIRYIYMEDVHLEDILDICYKT